MARKEPLTHRMTVRTTEADYLDLAEVADKIKCEVSDLIRYAIKKHIIEAKKKFKEHPDIWK